MAMMLVEESIQIEMDIKYTNVEIVNDNNEILVIER
jgi:hypothetical protein